MAGLPVLALLIMQADAFVLGRVGTSFELGLYSMAIALAGFPLTIFSKVVQPLVVPTLVTFQENHEGMQRAVLGLTRLVWLFGLPLTAVISVVGGPLLVMVYGREDFLQAAPAFGVYSLFTVFYMASAVSFSVYLAIGRPGLQRRFTIVRALVLVAIIYPLTVLWGGLGAALSLLVAMIVAMGVQLVNLRRVIGLSIPAYLATLGGGILAAAVAGLAALAMVMFVPIAPWAKVIVAAAIGALCWGALLLRERRTLQAMRRPK